MTIDWTKPIETVPCERNPNPVPCEFVGTTKEGNARYFIRGDWFGPHGQNQRDFESAKLPWTDCDWNSLPQLRNTTPAIDWTKPLELMDGTPVVLDPEIAGNPDRDGDYWIVREDGEKIQLSEPNCQYRTMCVRSNGMEESIDVQIVRNRAEPAAAPEIEVGNISFSSVSEVATLRDQFAMAALTGFARGKTVKLPDQMAELCYLYANAMMQARK